MHGVHMTATRRFPLKTPIGAKRLDTSIDYVSSVNMGSVDKTQKESFCRNYLELFM